MEYLKFEMTLSVEVQACKQKQNMFNNFNKSCLMTLEHV